MAGAVNGWVAGAAARLSGPIISCAHAHTGRCRRPCASRGNGAPIRCGGCSNSILVDRFGYRRRSNTSSSDHGETGPRSLASRTWLPSAISKSCFCAAVERCADLGDELILTVELDSRRSPARYERAGLEMLEEVITYELGTAREPWSGSEHIRLVRVQANDEAAIDLVTSIDLESFPWLWRNNRAEFDVYLQSPGAEVWLVEADGEPVAYLGVTLFPDWGHLDRIAVVPSDKAGGSDSRRWVWPSTR